MARLHEAHGEFDAARDALERGLTLTARDNWLHRELETQFIRLYQRANRVPELAARWHAAAETTPRDLDAWRRLESLAEAQGDLAGERAALEKLVVLAPSDAEDTLKLARRLADDGDRPRAAALYDGLLKIQPDNVDLILARAELDLQLGQPAAAVDRIEARVARNPADEGVATPALAFFLEHHLDAAAEKRLQDAAARQPAVAESRAGLGKIPLHPAENRRRPRGPAGVGQPPGDPAACATRWTQAAGIFREQNLAPDALHAWQEAAKLQPHSPAPLLAAGELLLARGDKTAAAEQIERAAAVASPRLEQIDAEHRWFEVLQSMEDQDGGRAALIPGLPADPGAVRPGQPLGRHLAALEKTAAAAPTGDNFLRLARWQVWAHLSGPALASATQAVAADPANLAARELVVATAADLHRPAEAEAQLQELAARDPARKNDYERQLAHLKMDDGDLDAAVAILTRLQQAAPGSREALSDLALAQQRADRWYDALGTWERADALPGGTPAQREQIRRPLLAAYERLSQFPRAAEILRAAVDKEPDLAAKTDRFHELAAFWRRHDLGPGLREDYEKRLAARPDDYFLLTALAELRRADGRERDAFALLQRAFWSSPDPVRSLHELVEKAGELGDDTEAVAQQRRLVTLPNQGTAANLEKLAALENADLDDPAATRTWDLAVAKFPRDTTLLGHAADFFAGADRTDRARELLRQLVAVDGTDGSRLLRLGQLDAQAGDLAGAQVHFEQLLARTAPETADEPLFVPEALAVRGEPAAAVFESGGGAVFLARTRGAGRTKGSEAPESEERRLRLQAIENLSRLLFPVQPPATAPALDGPQRAWLQRWQIAADAGAKSEPLAAFYFSARADLTLSLLARWTGRDDPVGDTALDAFLDAGLRLGGYRPLADWAWHGADRAVAAVRGQRLLGTLEIFLRTGGKPRPGMVAELFPADLRVQDTLWTAALNGFAASHWYEQAAELGERVLALATSARAGVAVQVAEWEMDAGTPGRARDALRWAVEDPDGNGHELDAPEYLALRGYYLLLPENERAGFVARHLGRRDLRDGSAQAALESALLHGLSGADEAAHRDLDALLAMRQISATPTELSPDGRRWTYLLTCGDQLQRWNLSGLAIHLWRHALAEAGAFDQQLADVDGTILEIRHRLLQAEVATAADPQRARECVQEFLGDQTEPSAINGVAAQLWNDGQHEAAAPLYETLYRIDPKNTDYWPNLYRFYENGGNPGAAERLLTDLLAGNRPLPAGVGRPEIIGDLAALREKRGDARGALRLLEHARQAMPGTLPVLLQLAGAEERANRWDDAAGVWREALPLDPGHTALLGLAAVEEHRGNRGGAIETLRGGLKDGPDPGRGPLAIQLTQTLLADHRVDEARQFAADLLARGQTEVLPAVGAAFTADGQGAVARGVLSDAVGRTRDPAARFHLQQALVEQAGPDPADFVRQMRRLGKFAQASAALRAEYDDLLYPLAHPHGADAWLEGELQRTWQHGRGDPASGVRLAGLYLQNHRDDALRGVVAVIDARADLPEDLLYRLATSLVESDHAPLALALCERLTRRFPQKLEYQLERALALWKSDRHPEATQVLTNLAALAVFRDEVWEPIAAFYQQQGDKSLESPYLERIVKNDPVAARAPDVWLRLAEIALDENRVPDAGRLLRVVYARPAADDLGPLVRYLKASGQLDGARALGMPAPDFPLSFERRARLLAAVRDELTRSGRPDAARRLLETHAEFLAAVPALATELARTATPQTAQVVSIALERAADYSLPVSGQLAQALSELYATWATWETNAPTAQASALAHLSRAFELTPDDFAVAGPLARLFVQQKQPEQAAKVLAVFLTPDALPLEREQARQILAAP